MAKLVFAMFVLFLLFGCDSEYRPSLVARNDCPLSLQEYLDARSACQCNVNPYVNKHADIKWVARTTSSRSYNGSSYDFESRDKRVMLTVSLAGNSEGACVPPLQPDHNYLIKGFIAFDYGDKMGVCATDIVRLEH